MQITSSIALLCTQYAVISLAAPPPSSDPISSSTQSPNQSSLAVSAAATSSSPYYGYFRTVVGSIDAELPHFLTKYLLPSLHFPPKQPKLNPLALQRSPRNQKPKCNPQHPQHHRLPPLRPNRRPHRHSRLPPQQPAPHLQLHRPPHPHKPNPPPRQPRPSPPHRPLLLRKNPTLPQTRPPSRNQQHRRPLAPLLRRSLRMGYRTRLLGGILVESGKRRGSRSRP